MIKPGKLTLPQARQLNELLNFHDGLINSAGTGDLDFSVGIGGITAQLESPEIQVVQVVNGSPSLDQRWDAQIVTYNELSNTYSTSGNQGTSPVWLREANTNILISGEYYVALGTGYNPDYVASGGLYNDARSVYTTNTTASDVDIQVQVLTTQVNTSGSLEVSSGNFVTTSGWYSGVIQSYLSGQYQSGTLQSGSLCCWFMDNNGRYPVSGWIYNVVVVDTDSSGVLVVAADTWTNYAPIFADLISLPQGSVVVKDRQSLTADLISLPQGSVVGFCNTLPTIFADLISLPQGSVVMGVSGGNLTASGIQQIVTVYGGAGMYVQTTLSGWNLTVSGVSSGMLALNAVTSGTISQNAVTPGTISANAVTSGTIGSDAIQPGNINPSAITGGAGVEIQTTASTNALNVFFSAIGLTNMLY